MQFNVSRLLREPIGATRHYALEGEAPVHGGQVSLLRVPGGILAHVEADIVLEDECSRCLAPFGYPVHVSFDETYYQQVDVVSGEHLAPPDEPEPFFIDRSHVIDITDAVRQYSEMAAAMQPLCRPDCPGMCPVCGTDLTIETCDCDRTPQDPRWAALASLRTLDV